MSRSWQSQLNGSFYNLPINWNDHTWKRKQNIIYATDLLTVHPNSKYPSSPASPYVWSWVLNLYPSLASACVVITTPFTPAYYHFLPRKNKILQGGWRALVWMCCAHAERGQVLIIKIYLITSLIFGSWAQVTTRRVAQLGPARSQGTWVALPPTYYLSFIPLVKGTPIKLSRGTGEIGLLILFKCTVFDMIIASN